MKQYCKLYNHGYVSPIFSMADVLEEKVDDLLTEDHVNREVITEYAKICEENQVICGLLAQIKR